jgi:uncharacterized membrane protein YeiH
MRTIAAMAEPLLLLDYLGVAVFACTGALVAARKRQDFIAFIAFSIFTGVGGGTLRDLLMGVPVFWVHSSGYLMVCLASAAAIWLLGERLWRSSALIWLDAVGLSVYAVIGAWKALNLGIPPAVAVVMGTITATFGGLLRDLFSGTPSALLQRELYITAAIAAAAVFVALRAISNVTLVCGALAFLAGFVLRAGAITRHWTLPGFRG